jgi:hypothetical protein
MALLNYAIFQMNTGLSQSTINTTLQQFHQYYAERAASTNQRELDPSMLDVATKLGVAPTPLPPSPPPPTRAQDTISPPTLIKYEAYDNNPSSSTSIFSPKKPYEIKSDDEDTPKQSSKELPVVKTKIFDDGRHKQRRTKQKTAVPTDNEPVHDEDLPESTIF